MQHMNKFIKTANPIFNQETQLFYITAQISIYNGTAYKNVTPKKNNQINLIKNI